jgi:hypothetical protein
MSSDPADDCTFWFVSQYYATENLWTTQIASIVFPPGSGQGQCPVTTCATRPALQPSGLAATTPGDNQITLNWNGITPTPGAYAIERAQGACSSQALYRPLAAVPGIATSFTDTTVQGGIQYSYRVRAAADAAGKCQALLAGACANATATGCSDPAEASSMTVAEDKDTYSWSVIPTATRYDVVRGSIGAFPIGPGGGDETCFPDLDVPSLTDSTLPAPQTGFWYLSRGKNACGIGPYGLGHDGNPRVTTTCP